MINDIATADREACEQRWYCSGVLFIALAFASLPTMARAGFGTWTSIGPDGGSVIDVVMDPDNSDVLYAATAGGGIFRTQDGGLTWQPRNNGLALLAIDAVAIGSSPTPTLYAATSTFFNGSFHSHFYASTDAGDNWIARSSPTIVNRLVVDPTDAAVIYAASARSVWYNWALYRSLDGGQSWSQALGGPNDIAVASDGTIYASTSAGLQASHDRGQTWSPTLAAPNAQGLAVSASDPALVFVAVGGGVYRSQDGGASWDLLVSAPTTGVRITIDPSNPDVVYTAAFGGVLKSQDRGLTWNATGSLQPWTPGSITKILVDQQNPQSIFLGLTDSSGTPGGVMHSQDGGSSWLRANAGIRAVGVTDVVTTPANPDVTFVLTSYGILRTTDGGTSWKLPASPLGMSAAAVDPHDSQTVVAVGGVGLCVTRDQGSTWACPETNRGYYFSAVAFDPVGEGTVYAGTSANDVWKSTDHGVTWTVLAPSVAPQQQSSLQVLVVDSTNPANLFAGFSDGSVQTSVNSGATWTPAAGVPGAGFSALVTSVDGHTLYAGMRGRCGDYGCALGSVHKSTNGAQSWVAASAGLTLDPGLDVFSVLVDPQTPNTIYASTAGGVFRSRNGAATWQSMNDGLTGTYPVPVWSLAIDQAATRIYAGTGGLSVYRFDLSGRDTPTATPTQTPTTSKTVPSPTRTPTPPTAPPPVTVTTAPSIQVSGIVTNAVTGARLGSVVVTLAGQTKTTDGNGEYAFAAADLSLGAILTASTTGFNTFSTELTPPNGAVAITEDISLGPESSKPVVTGATAQYHGLFLAGVPIPNRFTATVAWNGNPGTVDFYANGQLKASVPGGANGASTVFDMGMDFTGSLTPGANSVRVIAANAEGQVSDTVRQSVIVLPLPIATLDFLPDFKLHTGPEGITISLAVSVPDPPINKTLTLPVIGKWGVDLGVAASLDYTIGSGAWTATLSPGPMKLYFNDNEADFSINGSESGTATQSQGIVLRQASLGISLGGSYDLGQVGLLDLVTPGLSDALGAIPGLGDLLKTISIVLSLEPQFGGSATFAFDPAFAFQGLQASGDVGLKASYEPDLGVATMDLYVGGKPGMDLQVPGELIKDLRFRAYAGVDFNTWFFTLGPYEYVFVDVSYPSASGFQAQHHFVLKRVANGVAGEHTMSRAYLNAGPPRFVAQQQPQRLQAFRALGAPQRVQLQAATPSPTPNATVNLTLVQNVFPNGQPALAANGTSLMLLYVSDNGTPESLQRTDIDWMYYDGNNWSTPQPILADTRAEFAPQVAFDGNGDAVAAWERVKDPNFSGDLTAMAADMEIVWARWDHMTQTWAMPQALTDNSVLDDMPQLTGPLADGSLLAVWTENAQNLLLGDTSAGSASADTVFWAQWNPSTQSWSTPQMLLSGLTYRTSQSLAGTGNTAIYVWTQDLDGNLATTSDQEIFYREWTGSGWGTAQRLTNDSVADQHVRAAVAASGDISLVWQQDQALVLDRNLADQPTVARPNSQTVAFTDFALALEPTGNLIVVWSEQTPDGSSARDIVYDPASGLWSQDQPLLRGTDVTRSFAPTFDSMGNLTVAYDDVHIQMVSKTVTTTDGQVVTIDNVPQPGQVDLAVVKHALATDPGFQPGAFTANGATFLPGDTVTLTATVRNLSDLPVQDVQVAFYDGDPNAGGTEILPRQTISGFLNGGATATVTTTWMVPEPAAPHTLFAMIDPDGTISDFNPANNRLSVSVGGTDLTVAILTRTVQADGSARVIVQVNNNGAPAAPSCTLAIRYAGTPGSPITTTIVPALDAGALAQLALSLPPGTLTIPEQLFTVTADDAGVVAEVDRSNNEATFGLDLPISCSLDVDQDGTDDVATDVVYIARTLLGLPPVPASFRVLDPTIPPDATIAANVTPIGTGLDVDGSGSPPDVATDMVYIARHLLGLPAVPASFRAMNPNLPADSVISANVDALCAQGG